MQDMEVIFGGEDALGAAIRSAIRQDVSVVYVLSTCIVETIGDDVAAVCGRDWGVPVVRVPTAGFLGGSFQTGVSNALTAIAGTMPGRVLPKDPHIVNIIGEKNLEYEVEENYREVARLLALLGLTINVRFVHCTGINELAGLGEASLNILRDDEMQPVGDLLYRKYRIPSIPSFPVGLSGSLDFLKVTGDLAGIDPAPAISDEKDRQDSLLDGFSGTAGSMLRFSLTAPDLPANRAISEVIARLDLKVGKDGARVPMPPSPPVGTEGVRRMLHRWRRALNAGM